MDGFIRQILDIMTKMTQFSLLTEIIKYRGLPVSPVEIEQFLLTHESVTEVAVAGIEHKSDDQ
jgi:acyl-CoA synthetase (AMP-forming)/AMP-acid ligase II